MPRDDKALAETLIGRLDLTELKDGCTAADVDRLLAKAVTPAGNVAAVCVWPAFVRQSVDALKGTGIKVATVVNFPTGGDDVAATEAETRQAVADGADEVDLVVAYRHAATDPGFIEKQVRRVKQAAAPARLKAILETGELGSEADIRAAAKAAIAGGADFIKTSTGKTKTGATETAVRIMLDAIAETDGRVGLKPSGGMKVLADAALFYELAQAKLGADWPTADRFRLGASSILTDLLAHAGVATGAEVKMGDGKAAAPGY